MTVETNDTVERYTVSGVGPYGFSFRVFDEDDIAVTAISGAGVPAVLAITTNYTVAGVDDEDGGTITLTTGAATAYASYTLDIRSNTAEYQPTSIRNQGSFLPEVHEDAFDRLSRQIQDLSRRSRASLRYPDDEVTDAVAPAVASRKGRYLFANVITGAFEWVTSIATTALSQSIFNQYLTDGLQFLYSILNPRTAAEIAAGVTPVNYAIPSHEATGGIVIPSRYTTNTVPGTTDMTAALNTVAAFCRTNEFTLQLEPATCLVSGTIDFSGIVVDGLGFNLDGDPHIRATSAQFNVVNSTGRTVLRNLWIDGGWNGSTAGQSGDGISIMKTTGDLFPYDVYLHNVAVFNAKKRGIYNRYGAYSCIDRAQVSLCGLHGLEIEGNTGLGKPATTIRISGGTTLSSTPNGYGAKLTDFAMIDFDHVIMEGTSGILVAGTDNRSLNLNAVYQESGIGSYFLDVGSSNGVGLSITNCIGGGEPVAYPTNWESVNYSGNSLLTESAVPLAGHIIQADGGTLSTTTTGGVNVTAASVTLPPGTYIITGTVQTLTSTATSATQAACCLTTTVGDSGLSNDTSSSFKIGADQGNFSAGAGLDYRLNCLLPYQNTTSGNVTMYLRAKFTFSGAGTLTYRGFINALKIH